MLNIKKITALTLSALSLESCLFCSKLQARELYYDKKVERAISILDPSRIQKK